MSDFEEDGYSTVQSTVHNSDLVEYANKLHKGNSLLIHGLKLIKLLIGYDKKNREGGDIGLLITLVQKVL